MIRDRDMVRDRDRNMVRDRNRADLGHAPVATVTRLTLNYRDIETLAWPTDLLIDVT